MDRRDTSTAAVALRPLRGYDCRDKDYVPRDVRSAARRLSMEQAEGGRLPPLRRPSAGRSAAWAIFTKVVQSGDGGFFPAGRL